VVPEADLPAALPAARAMIREAEGITLVLPADHPAVPPGAARFAQITLGVHSALDAVGLTAAAGAPGQAGEAAMRRALVTGGNRGIGLAIAAGLRAVGLDVLIGSRDRAAGVAAAGPIGARAVQLDLEDAAGFAPALAKAGPIDVLVNNAGILETVPFLGDNDNFARSMQVMVHAPFELMRAVIPGMAARGHGRIVNVSSGWGSFAEGLNGGGAYGIAKAALNALTLRAAQEVSPCIKVNAMCPGWVQTRMGGAGAPRSPEAGAATAIWLATLPADGPTGGFFRDRRPVPW
jgi:NAD(P)-dependent dehydrogenase (short-subunit alcohol dehydrogenase family)